MRPEDYQPLLDKVRTRISSWSVRHLSYASRLQLIQSVIYSLINFWAAVFPLPKKFLEELERLCSSYLWKGEIGSARDAKVSWDSVCTPKICGGLGLKKLVAWNHVFTLKLIWLLFTKGGSLWISWVSSNLINGRLFWDIPNIAGGSWIWKSILKVREAARPFLYCKIGTGTNALFWHDDWTNLGPLINLFGANGPRVTGILRLATVAQAKTSNAWRLPRGRHPITVLLKDCLPSPSTFNSNTKDMFLWKNSNTMEPGQFSSSKTWTKLHPLTEEVNWANSVWFSNNIPKHSFLMWLYER